jgi:hypothetical protein
MPACLYSTSHLLPPHSLLTFDEGYKSKWPSFWNSISLSFNFFLFWFEYWPSYFVLKRVQSVIFPYWAGTLIKSSLVQSKLICLRRCVGRPVSFVLLVYMSHCVRRVESSRDQCQWEQPLKYRKEWDRTEQFDLTGLDSINVT